jgi:DNA-directed RNA polymerase specialized sigma24 family protein
MNKDWVLTQESFDALLTWLDPNRDQAGRKYEEIRLRLIKLFTCRGCYEPEDLADETINRVTKRLKDIEAEFEGEKARYFCGVANKVNLESLKRRPMPPQPPPPNEPDDTERIHLCLEKCIEELLPDSRLIVVQYYQEEKLAKINHRKHLAEQLGIALNALRIRAYRIRVSLEHCVQNCLEQSAT